MNTLNEAARKYLNGQIDRKQATAWLAQYAMTSPARAEQRTRFFDTYRSYVINYNLGKDLVKQYVESRGGIAAHPAKRWDVSPRRCCTARRHFGYSRIRWGASSALGADSRYRGNRAKRRIPCAKCR